MPETISTTHACVERILERCGLAIRVAMPLGLGKPNILFNALYERIVADPQKQLTIYTALSLARPRTSSDLEKRFIGPFMQRHLGADYPDLAYVAAQQENRLPPNVRVHEFYLQSGAMLGVGQSQRDYISMNYTHVARDVVDSDINLILQLVAVREENGRRIFSLACNPDVTGELLDRLAAAGKPRPTVVGVVHPDLPFVGNEAIVDVSFFDIVLDDPTSRPTLFALVRDPVSIGEYALGLHASALVRDGGTLQIGIGALSDALVQCLLVRHRDNDRYTTALRALNVDEHLIAKIGGTQSFSRGLYGASEMVMDGFMQLAQAGILKRRVYDDFAIESAIAHGDITDILPNDAASRLRANDALPDVVGARELTRLKRFGVIPSDAELCDDALHLSDGATLPLDLRSDAAIAAWNMALNGKTLREGRYLRGAFFLGSKDFYAWLRDLKGDAFYGLSMTRVSDINQVYGGREALDCLQRRDARFFNTCMMATALGAAVSDGLESGQVVSGVGGQYNFVAMAHALEGGRSILLLRSTRTSKGRAHSNILWNYGYTTIPRHLRDIYVTEYGSADLRGKSDEDCTIAMLALCDARFIDALAVRAKSNGKLRRDFSIPDRWRENTPERLQDALRPIRSSLPQFPFGSDFTPDEQALLPALQRLQTVTATKPALAAFLLSTLWKGRPTPEMTPLLRRLGLDVPKNIGERLLRRLVSTALRASGRGV
ncbi:MAG TPA: acetyl-CoA hydrolase/transferase C-terminal domain-containing protein [Rudaea sp.]|nr:acetyl-CoA hydrolase/transferase C-terminal domain-containing protein [Rudaea sp.]